MAESVYWQKAGGRFQILVREVRRLMKNQPTETEIQEESRRIRRLQLMMNLVMSVISQGNLPLEEASDLIASTKRAALNLFPDKELAYDLIYRPRLQRLLREKYRIC